MHCVLVKCLIAIFLSNELSLFPFGFRNLNLEFLSNLASDWVIKSVQQLAHNPEGLRHYTASLARMVADNSTFYSRINDADTAERGG